MPPDRKPERGRGERTAPGIWRLRLPLPWPGVPHGNAWALQSGDGIVLVDTGIHGDESIEDLELAMRMVGLRIEDVSLLVCTHAHSDHYGEASEIVRRADCELWMHPDYEHIVRLARDPDALLDARLGMARRAGVPEERLEVARELRTGRPSGIREVIEPDRDLVEGAAVKTDHGLWHVIETPGHAPSHVCLWQPDRRLLMSGDHLLGRIHLYFDYGYSPDPIGEFLASLERIRGLGARLCLSGHGRTFTDIEPHIDGNVSLVRERLAIVEEAIAASPQTAFEITPLIKSVFQGAEDMALLETLCYLRHLEENGRAEMAAEGDGIERWTAVTAR